jgi:hypothetical protein
MRKLGSRLNKLPRAMQLIGEVRSVVLRSWLFLPHCAASLYQLRKRSFKENVVHRLDAAELREWGLREDLHRL